MMLLRWGAAGSAVSGVTDPGYNWDATGLASAKGVSKLLRFWPKNSLNGAAVIIQNALVVSPLVPHDLSRSDDLNSELDPPVRLPPP